MELLQRIASNGGQLLKIEAAGEGLLLTFDVGRLLLQAEPVAGGISATHVAEAGDVVVGSDLAEAEPWWRFLGNPLTAVEAEGTDLRIRFRGEGQNPRWVRLSAGSRAVSASLEES